MIRVKKFQTKRSKRKREREKQHKKRKGTHIFNMPSVRMQFGISNIKQQIVKRRRSPATLLCCYIARTRVQSSHQITRSPAKAGVCACAYASLVVYFYNSNTTHVTLFTFFYLFSHFAGMCFIYLFIYHHLSLSLCYYKPCIIQVFFYCWQVFMCRKKSTLFLFQLKWYLMCTNK